jgi:hypothetical protein
MNAHDPRTPRWPARDLLVPAVAAVAVLTYALHGFHGSLTRDLSLYSYAGQQVADGVPPYLGVLNRAGPLAHVLPGVGVLVARLGGFDDVVTMRVLFLFLATACTTAVYVLARDLFRQRTAGVVAAAVFLGFHGFIQYASDGPREKTPMTLFVVLALWAVVHRRWATAGVFVSLATLCLQISFFPAVAATVVGTLVLERGSRLRALARVALGGLVPVALFAVWFALAGSLGPSVEAFFLINARYTTPDPALTELPYIRDDAIQAYGGVWVTLFLLGIVLLVAGAVRATRPASREEPGVRVTAALAAGVVVGLLWDLRDYDSWADLFPLLPFGAVGVASLVPLVTGRVTSRGLRTATVAATAVGTAALVVASVQWSVTTRTDALDAERRAVDAVVGALPAGAALASIEAPQPLVFTGQTNPSRHQMFRGGLQTYVDDTWPGGLRGFVRDLVDAHPAVISMGPATYDYWRTAIAPQYVCVGNAPGWSWWADRSLGRRTLTALRTATGYTAPDDCALHAVAQ